MSTRFSALLLVLALCLPACANRAWRTARAADSTSEYHRFLREHGDSQYAPEARERMAMVRVRSTPSLESYAAFREEFPDSELLAELRPYVEEQFFLAARMRGTAAAYHEVLREFPDGAFAARARGNAEYLEQGGFGDRIDELRDFAARHPESDYAAEAQRSVATAQLKRETAFRRVGLVMDIPASAASADRLVRVFTERAVNAYQAARLELIPMSNPNDPRLGDVAAVLTISHREQAVKTEIKGGNITQSGILARIGVTLARTGDETPIWTHTFDFRAAASEQRTGVSILFGAGSTAFWSDFFVPIASWNTRVAIREASSFAKPAVAVELIGSRAIVLFGDGDLQVLDLGDPASPSLVAEYRRPRDLSHFDGLAFVHGRIVIYGPDGIEIVRFGAKGLERERVHARDAVGSIVGVEGFGTKIVVASNRGLLAIGTEDAEVQRLVTHEIFGLARSGDRLLFTNGISLYVGTLPLLEAGRVEGELRMGRGFGPSRVRAAGSSVVVLGERGTAWVDISRPSQPRIRSRIGSTEVGEVHDAVVVGGRLFLLGVRGLQVSDPSGEHIVNSADVQPLERLAATGRHLVMVGDKSLQVVDATPFFSVSAAAAPR